MASAHPVPEGQVDHELDELEDLLAVENQIDKSVVAIAPPPPDFLGERLVSIAPAPKDFPGERLTSTKEEQAANTYAFSYETEDGSKRTESGGPLASGGMTQSGSWEYQGPNGQVYKIEFTADERGFRPIGRHLPKPPALPPALQRFEDARNGRLKSRGVASAAILRQGRVEQEEDDPNFEVEFIPSFLIRFGPKEEGFRAPKF